MTTRPSIRLDLTVLDAADIAGLADFYRTILGWDFIDADDDWITIRPAEGVAPGMAFQLAPDHVAPTWPDGAVPQQSHLDLDVVDLDEAEAFVLEAGATATGLPEGEGHTFRVYLDPAGHPFCLCREPA
ncbi:putative enzyme related to lactoylglutathione lyase [Frondihabitans sp. PhB188]|uniref:VOC family protein n=1 Tax=Frondihabitans sp. PhB188 TaxID=2485200 RepID=UPI000F49137A|nr:VOC family protein [Frondihabitans sp. PhB188]ROQ38476.1 putative enzyme related to lactoylglutathione lyase [Frondihabitans sp. PhB188]